MSQNPIKKLVEEHQYILKVVNALDYIGKELAKGTNLDEQLFRNIIDFMREFADKCHHAKEEDLLFPALIELGVPESGCPIGGLKGEHIKGRTLVSHLEEGVDLYKSQPENAIANIKDAIDGIVKLYPEHIWKEDQMVFPMAERLFNEGRLAQLARAFDEVESEKGENHRRFEKFANTLAAETHQAMANKNGR